MKSYRSPDQGCSSFLLYCMVGCKFQSVAGASPAKTALCTLALSLARCLAAGRPAQGKKKTHAHKAHTSTLCKHCIPIAHGTLFRCRHSPRFPFWRLSSLTLALPTRRLGFHACLASCTASCPGSDTAVFSSLPPLLLLFSLVIALLLFFPLSSSFLLVTSFVRKLLCPVHTLLLKLPVSLL